MNQSTSESSRVGRSVISVHTKSETSKRLDELAALTRRSKSFLANEAIERYLEAEEMFVASVKRGLTDADARRTVSTEAAKQRVAAFIDQEASNADRS